jgi:hypothetical protein
VTRVAAAIFLVVMAASCSGRAEVPGARTSRRLSPREFRVVAMELLQRAAEAEMDVFRSKGRFSERPQDLVGAHRDRYIVTSGIGAPGRVSIEVCGGNQVVVLGTEAGEGSVFAVKIRGLQPASGGMAVFSHYDEDPLCDARNGSDSWSNGYRITTRGLAQEAAA